MRGSVLEILAHAVFELLRLADVDDLPGFVLHQIYARLERQTQCLVFQFFKRHLSKKKLPQSDL